MRLGYELGRAHQEQGRLREVKRVLELEAASYKTPDRVEIVARTLLSMEAPPPERIVLLPAPGPTGEIEVRAMSPTSARDLEHSEARLETAASAGQP
jgi:hypothetical protein